MKKEKLIFNYVILLMVIAETPWARYVSFISIPLFLYSIFGLIKSNYRSIKLINPLIYIFVIGLFGGFFQFFNNNNTYYYLRDILYFIQAPIAVVIGMYIVQNNLQFKRLIKIIVLVQFFSALYAILKITSNPSLLFQINLQSSYELNLKFTSSILAFAIIYYARNLKFKIFQDYQEKFLMTFFIFCVFISFSRTSYLLLFITFVIPWIIKTKMTLKVYWINVTFLLVIIFGGLFLNINDVNGKGSRETFMGKVSNSLHEITIKDYETAAEINHNWRGYESFMGLSKFYKGSLVEIVFGQGFGAVVYSPYWIFKGEKLNIVPMFHNSFITILLKTGLVGLVIFIILLFKYLRIGIIAVRNKIDLFHSYTGQLLILISFMLFFRSLVIHGIYFTVIDVSLLILLGSSLRSLAKINKLRVPLEKYGKRE